MALVACADCGKEMSSEAVACPNCGRPSTKAANKAKDSKQSVGCVIVLVGLLMLFFLPSVEIGIFVILVGVVIAVINMRLW